jgi:streptomycin 6-kinase
VTLPVPEGARILATRDPATALWVRRLPRLTSTLLDEWGLTVDGEPTTGFTALVVPVVTEAGERAVLKLLYPGEEEEHEHLALQRWGGDGAVRLLRADPARRSMLLERLHRRDLTEVPVLEAIEIVAGLYPRLHVPALPQLRPQMLYVERWTDNLARLPKSVPIPHRLVEQAVSLGRDLIADPASVGTMIHGDLHYENVLAGDRAPWLVIDPKPTSGDPHYEVAPLLWNRWDELHDNVRDGVRRRFHTTVDAADLDEDRARDWVVVRMIHNAMWEIEDHPEAPDDDYLTLCVIIAKAVQD